ncbi:hypothetical protein CC86DRAFT_7105 [Ophiobolus disseminans]|uniref:C2H2-type domain-containing protein n=1 Tax=Ophiobolus disseminans TaxID=1469910 RepID=A0A6A7AJE1_9PLEO|nr:hypothetical protein CC86DRAFT_7105 [Ophiobolus disseminans]
MTPVIYELESHPVADLSHHCLSEAAVDNLTLRVPDQTQSKRRNPMQHMFHSRLSPLATPASFSRDFTADSQTPPGMVSGTQSLAPSPVSPATPSSAISKHAQTYGDPLVSPINGPVPSQRTPLQRKPLSPSEQPYTNEGATFEDGASDWASLYQSVRLPPDNYVAMGLGTEWLNEWQLAQGLSPTAARRQNDFDQRSEGNSRAVYPPPVDLLNESSPVRSIRMPERDQSDRQEHHNQHAYVLSHIGSTAYSEPWCESLIQNLSPPIPSAGHTDSDLQWDEPHSSVGLCHSGQGSKWYRKLCRTQVPDTGGAVHQASSTHGASYFLHETNCSASSSQQRVANQEAEDDVHTDDQGSNVMYHTPTILHGANCTIDGSHQHVSMEEVNDESLDFDLVPADSKLPSRPKKVCPHCGQEFTGKYGKGNCARHVRQKHGLVTATIDKVCRVCEHVYNRADAKRKHEWKKHRMLDSRPNKRRKDYSVI